MAEGDLERESRRMKYTVDRRPVFAVAITNADLEKKDELDDELAELRIQHKALAGEDIRDVAHTDEGDEVVMRHIPGEIDECVDAERRKEMRADARKLMAEIRRLETRSVSLLIADEAGERFPEEALMALPYRVALKLAQEAAEYAFGLEDEERPTTARSATG